MHMARQETIVQLTDELVSMLDNEARRRGTSRSALVREAVTSYLADSRERAITEAIVRGYTDIPQATPDEWGDLAAQQDRSTAETHRQLEAEERRTGRDPW